MAAASPGLTRAKFPRAPRVLGKIRDPLGGSFGSYGEGGEHEGVELSVGHHSKDRKPGVGQSAGQRLRLTGEVRRLCLRSRGTGRRVPWGLWAIVWGLCKLENTSNWLGVTEGGKEGLWDVEGFTTAPQLSVKVVDPSGFPKHSRCLALRLEIRATQGRPPEISWASLSDGMAWGPATERSRGGHSGKFWDQIAICHCLRILPCSPTSDL